VAESLQESELGVEWLAAQGVAVDPLPVPLLGVAALPSMGRVAFEALLPEQATSVDQSAAPQLALVPVGAQSPSQTVPQLVPLALLVAALAGKGQWNWEGCFLFRLLWLLRLRLDLWQSRHPPRQKRDPLWLGPLRLNQW